MEKVIRASLRRCIFTTLEVWRSFYVDAVPVSVSVVIWCERASSGEGKRNLQSLVSEYGVWKQSQEKTKHFNYKLHITRGFRNLLPFGKACLPGAFLLQLQADLRKPLPIQRTTEEPVVPLCPLTIWLTLCELIITLWQVHGAALIIPKLAKVDWDTL